MNNSKVKVSGDKVTGAVVMPTGNPLFGTIRVEQTRTIFDDNGFATQATVSALIQGKIDVLTSLKWKKGDEIGGKIVIRESLTPFNTKDPDKDLKVAGKTNVVCTFGGNPIYRKTFYTGSEKAEDELLAHDNSEEIKAANAKLKEETSANPGAINLGDI
jgi:hypothetical protein